MLMPKRIKYRKQQRGRMRGLAYRGAEVHVGDFGLQALEPGWVPARQIEAARRAIVHALKRRGKIWIRIFPDKPYTHRAAETRMGKGKGNVEYWVAVVRPGRILLWLVVVLRKIWHTRPCAWRSINSRSRRKSWPARIWEVSHEARRSSQPVC